MVLGVILQAVYQVHPVRSIQNAPEQGEDDRGTLPEGEKRERTPFLFRVSPLRGIHKENQA